MQRTHRRHEAALFVLLTLLGACSSAKRHEKPHKTQDSGTPTPPADAGVVDSSAGCKEGDLLPCPCPDQGEGTQACEQGSLGACLGCVTTKPVCVPGVYKMAFRSDYSSTASGLCGVVGTDQVQVSMGEATFTLEKKAQGEFYRIGNGCIHIAGQDMDGGITDIAWRGEFTGEVDCSTGELVAEMRSTYSVVSFCTLGLVRERFFAKGPLHAKFNPDTQAFEQGTWEQHEPKVLIGKQPGGTGSFTATLDPGSDVPDAGLDCLKGIEFDDSVFDAGS